MKPLKELVTIDKRFRKSVNLQLDLGDYEKVNEYIPTKSSVAILKRYLKNVQGETSENANILIGPYGKGKSHLLLVLMAVLSGRSEKMSPLIKHMESIDAKATGQIKSIWKTQKPYLPVLLSTSGNNLNASFVQALRDALIREDLSDLAPDSYYSEAEKCILVWEKQFPDTFDRFQHLLEENCYETGKFMCDLRDQKEESLKLFMEVYPQLTSGSVFLPMLQQEALQVYREVNHKLCKDYGYAGIYIIFDEFSKYIEGHAEEYFSADMKVLQDLCELANNAGEEKLFITLVAHKSIHEYERVIPESVKNAFRGVEGRLKEIRFVVSAQNNYELIADTIRKREPEFTQEFQRRLQESHFSGVLEESFALPCFYSLFEKSDYQKTLAEGCFPLLPLCAYGVLHLSEKVAQNERTIFTFLTNDEPGSLVRLLNKGVVDSIGIDAVYDYFKDIFRDSIDIPQIHKEWLKADYALSLAENEEERRLIKALAVIRMIHREEEFPAQDKPIRLSLGMEQDIYEQTMKALIARGIVLYRSSLAMYAFKNNIGVDVEEEIKKRALLLSKGFQLCEKISEISELEYVIPRKYNQKYAMTRYFRYEYMTPEQFLKLEQAKYLLEQCKADGILIGLVSEEAIDVEQIKAQVQTLQEERMVVIVPKVPFFQKENVKRLTVVRALMQDEAFLEENKVLLQELKLYEEDLSFEINASLEESLMPEQGTASVVHMGVERSAFTAKTFHEFLSSILEEYYKHTPRVNHELLNIQNVTGQYLRARNQVVNDILKKEDCSKYLKGTNPEAMVYRAAFVRTGLIREEFKTDSALKCILEEIDRFFMQAAGQKQYFSELYEHLQGRHYGVRRGIIPLYIAMKLSKATDAAVIYLGNKELEINAAVLNHVNEFPEKYQLYIEPESMQTEQYLRKLEQFFCGGEELVAEQSRLREITDRMQKWYRSLPQYAMVSTNFAPEHREVIVLMRNYLKRAELNPRELLLERFPQVADARGIDTQGRDAQGTDATGTEDVADLLIAACRNLEQAMQRLEKEQAAAVRKLFGAKESDSLKGCLKSWQQQYEAAIEQSILSSLADNFMRYLKEFTTNDEAEIISGLSRSILDMYIEDWKDDTGEEFSSVLQQVKAEIEGVSKVDTEVEGMCQIILKDSSGEKIQKFYEANQDDSTAIYLKNVIDEALEDFGDTLETNQKVAVLVSAITELLQSGNL